MTMTITPTNPNAVLYGTQKPQPTMEELQRRRAVARARLREAIGLQNNPGKILRSAIDVAVEQLQELVEILDKDIAARKENECPTISK